MKAECCVVGCFVAKLKRQIGALAIDVSEDVGEND